MPSLSEIGDIDALENRYLDKTIIYVEGDGDQKLFADILGPNLGDKLEFRTPPNGERGCLTVISRVKKERAANSKIFGLVDGETAVHFGGVKDLLACRQEIFRLPDHDGILFLGCHELENMILMHGGVCELISRNVKLASLGNVVPAHVEQKLAVLTRRFFTAALVKYAISAANLKGAPLVASTSGRLIEPSLGASTWVKDIKTVVEQAGANWDAYRAEAKGVLSELFALFRAENLDHPKRLSHFIRLADGKHLLIALHRAFNQTVIADGILASALSKPPYADRFRQEVLSAVAIAA